MSATFNGPEKNTQHFGTNPQDSFSSDSSGEMSFSVREILGEMNFAVRDIWTHLNFQIERNRRLTEELNGVVLEKNRKVSGLERALFETEKFLEDERSQTLHLTDECRRLDTCRSEAETRLTKLRADAKRVVGGLQAEVKKLADEQHRTTSTRSDHVTQTQADLTREREQSAQLALDLKKQEDAAFKLTQELAETHERLTVVETALRMREEQCATLQSEIRSEKNLTRKLLEEHQTALSQARAQAEELTAQCDDWKRRFKALPQTWALEKMQLTARAEAQEERGHGLESRLSASERDSAASILALEKECRSLTDELELMLTSHRAELKRLKEDSQSERKRIADEFTAILLTSKKREEEAQAQAVKWSAAYSELLAGDRAGPSSEEYQKLKNEITRLKDTSVRLQLERDLAINQQTESANSARIRTESLEQQLAQTFEELAEVKKSYLIAQEGLEEEKVRTRVIEERLKAEVHHLQSKQYLSNLEIAALGRGKSELLHRAVSTLPEVSPTSDLAGLIREKNEEIEAVRRRLSPKRDIPPQKS